MFVRAYLRASTSDQNANRAKEQLLQFAAANKFQVASFYIENESGSTLDRPELMRLLNDAHSGDVLLIEQVDRLSRLKSNDWYKLRGMIGDKGIRVVALDLPTSHMLANVADEFTNRMLDALNGMMLDMLAAIARKDYEDRRRRQAQGIAANKSKFKGKQIDLQKHANVAKLLDQGNSYTEIQELLGVSRSTISRVVKLRVAP